MIIKAISAGFYKSPGWNKDFPKIQILTVEDLLNGKEIKYPPTSVTFKKAAKAEKKNHHQPEML